MKKLVAGMVMLLVVGVVSGQDDASKKDLKAMEGTWTITTLEIGAMKIPEEQIKKASAKLVVMAGKYKYFFGEKQQASGTIKLEGGKNPKQIDIIAADGETKGKAMPGIYQIEGDTMKVAVVQPGQERPTTFSTKEGTGQMLFTYKRVKK